MRTFTTFGVVVLAAMLPGVAMAADKDPCGVNMVCGSNPKSISDAVLALGYKAQPGTSTTGNPLINSAANGYDFTIFFSDCEQNKQCAAIEFRTTRAWNPKFTLEMVNRWNSTKRLVKMSLRDKEELRVSYDLATVGGLNQKNFNDIFKWWATVVGDVAVYLKENGF